MAKVLWTLAGAILLCSAGSVAALEPLAAVERSLSAQDYRLIIRGGRGGLAPGVTDEEEASARARCGERYLMGFGDVIEPDQQAEFERLAAYAEEYNRQMLAHCMSKAK
ncbi:hypothetical protein [Aeromonas cavernicola]|uniref:Uncharacterized protein n=1 Tax=Aeromonas cavernicola TaxID=1006623 RepID=A0A2H9U9A7_9GAMM|nr:hypothetical protein [Aeromonas cavernicola]PJG60595.1 hypothetical protein CUC53_00910 [Aeromonas cavernicola]